MNYLTLSPNDLTMLVRERITALEADHFRTLLQLDEGDPDRRDVLARQLQDLERRIELHRESLRPPADGLKPDAESADERGNPDTPEASQELVTANGHQPE